ncbi:MAG: 2-oxo acid dehydrogenase subunit E2 [Chloroflexi bacterium]|nr:MAG: 2-oxo acid dehydrogenase subunit E2 [Chloroflexota bacterium]
MGEVNMPKLSDTMEEGTVIDWKVKDGDEVKKGQVIAEVESDKASFEINADSEGAFHIIVEAGKPVPVGAPIAQIGGEAPAKPAHKEKEQAKEPAPEPQQAEAEGKAEPEPKPEVDDAEEKPAAKPREEAPAATADGGGSRIKASPVAARLAAEMGVNLAELKGSGPEGRIVKEDVLAAAGEKRPTAARAPERAAARPSGPEVEHEELTRVQTIIARRMAKSKAEVPHFYVTVEIRMDEAIKLQGQLRETVPGADKVSVADLIFRAAALAIRQHPHVNASWAGDHIEVKRRVNIGYAVAGQRSLIVPVLKDVDQMDLVQISTERRAIVERAVAGKPTPQDLEGGTFSISNLGTFGVDEFIAIVNQPESVILAVGATKDVALVEDGRVTTGKVMRVTGSADHRVVYGADLAEYLATFKKLLEAPVNLVLPPQ